MDREKVLLLKIPRTVLWDIADGEYKVPPNPYPRVSLLRDTVPNRPQILLQARLWSRRSPLQVLNVVWATFSPWG